MTEKEAIPRLDLTELARNPRLSESWDARERALPERVLQFGEGNFLRAFVDWMLERMNRRGLFNGRAVLVQPIAEGRAESINRQNGLYTVLLRGAVAGKMLETREVITSVNRCLDPHREFDQVLDLAKQPELRFVVSNTTEAGIRLDPEDRLEARPARSFPAKLTQLLYARFRHFEGDPSKGWILLPCELIERNGDALEAAVRELCQKWSLPDEFESWLAESSVFTNTLVDRIVTGFPSSEAEALGHELGYRDELMVAGEAFHCWVIESPRPVEKELPFVRAGLDVVWTKDMTPYRDRKVRILNGAHTMLAVGAFLAGKDTVRSAMEDPLLRSYVKSALREEILPTLSLPATELESFAQAVLERFENPFIHHQLLSISLNSVSKYKARLLGTVLDNQRHDHRHSPRLAFAMASLLAFYRGSFVDGAYQGSRDGTPYAIKDEPRVLEYFAEAWKSIPSGSCSEESCHALARDALARQDFWGCSLCEELPNFSRDVAEQLHAILSVGLRPALEQMLRALGVDPLADTDPRARERNVV